MKSEIHGNVLAPRTRSGDAANFLLNLGWSLCWLVRSGVRLLK